MWLYQNCSDSNKSINDYFINNLLISNLVNKYTFIILFNVKNIIKCIWNNVFWHVSHELLFHEEILTIPTNFFIEKVNSTLYTV